MLTQIRNLSCQLKRPNAEITLAIHRNLADKLGRPASWNANPNSYKAGRTDVGGVVMIKVANLYHTHLSRTPCAPVEESNLLAVRNRRHFQKQVGSPRDFMGRASCHGENSQATVDKTNDNSHRNGGKSQGWQSVQTLIHVCTSTLSKPNM